MAAMRFELGQDESSPILTLTVAPNGDTGGSQAVMAACITGSAWSPAEAGRWGDHPLPGCEAGSVTGVRSADTKTWSFALAPLLSDGVLDIVIVPGTVDGQPAGANGSSFSLSFNPPTGADLQTSAGAPAEGGAIDVPSDFTGGGDLSSGGGYSPPADVPSFSGGGASFDPVAAPSAGFTPSLPASEQGITATAPVVQQKNQPLATKPVSTVEDHKAIGVIVLVLCGGAVLWSAQQPTPAVRALGTFSSSRVPQGSAVPVEPQPGGLGRFTRPRSGAPPPL
jgi:hypothetical protein